MRARTVALISDVHGNVEALRAVLGALENDSWVELVVAGDIVSRCLHDAECIDLLRDLRCVAIAGNSDVWVATNDHPGAAEIRTAIGPERTAFLANLPLEHRITPPGGRSPDDDLLIVHATPREINAALIVEKHPLYPYSLTPNADARYLIGGVRASLIVGGHLHYSQSGFVGAQRFATIAPVSFANDGDPRAGYALTTWDGDEWKLDHRRTRYDVGLVADEIEHSGLEYASKWAEELRTAIVKDHYSLEYLDQLARKISSEWSDRTSSW